MLPPTSPDTETYSTPPSTPGPGCVHVDSLTAPLPAAAAVATATAAAAAKAASAVAAPTSNLTNQRRPQPQRRGSGRPHNLLIDPAKGAVQGLIGSDIVLQRTPDGEPTVLIPFAHSTSVPDIQEQSVSRPRKHLQQTNMFGALNSPCFVHSQLERDASLREWLAQQHANANVGVSKTSHPQSLPPTVTERDDNVSVNHANS